MKKNQLDDCDKEEQYKITTCWMPWLDMRAWLAKPLPPRRKMSRWRGRNAPPVSTIFSNNNPLLLCWKEGVKVRGIP